MRPPCYHKNVVQLLDLLSHNSDQDHFSPNNTHTFLSGKVNMGVI